jgi:hypothetical protein
MKSTTYWRAERSRTLLPRGATEDQAKSELDAQARRVAQAPIEASDHEHRRYNEDDEDGPPCKQAEGHAGILYVDELQIRTQDGDQRGRWGSRRRRRSNAW